MSDLEEGELADSSFIVFTLTQLGLQCELLS